MRYTRILGSMFKEGCGWKMTIRKEEKGDYRAVEDLTRQAFWNLYVPGCHEHYLVHLLRSHRDFIPELDLVVELNGKIIANVMYTRAKLRDENGAEKEILTFGPLSVLPGFQRKGYGKKLLEHSFQKAMELGFDTIVIFGNPENYVSRGFKSCKKYKVSIGEQVYPTAMLVKELVAGALAGKSWTYQESPAYEIEEAEAEKFDENFEPRSKEYQVSQELFDIYSRSTVTG